MEKLRKHIQGIIDKRKIKKEKYDSVKEVFHSLGVQTSLHGIPRILSSKHWYQRGLWTCLVLVTFGLLVFQIYHLVHEYTKYPIQTKLSMKRDTLQFPSVSLCNMNPIKDSSLSLISGSALHDFIAPRPQGDHLSRLSNLSIIVNSTTDYNLTDIINILFFNDDLDNYRFWNSIDAFIDYIKIQNNWEKEEWSLNFRYFKLLFQNQSKQSRKEWGHSIQDMLISCFFNERKCLANNFTLFQTTEYGNCYTLSSNLFITRKVGPMHGLQLILQVEKFELLNDLFDGTGFRLVIHEPGTFPFPQKEGYTISPGYETTIGMRMVRVMRAKPPYGICESGDVFYKTYGYRYSMQACLEICRFRKVVEICKCRPLDNIMDIKFIERFRATPICTADVTTVSNVTNITNSENEKRKYRDPMQCEEFIYIQIAENYINCGCESPCSQTLYQSTVSGGVWPKKFFLEEHLLKKFCRQSNHTYCKKYSEEKNSTFFKDNFLKLVIYYEDMNYEEISEEPSYDIFRFLSDLGGAMGLYLGASILSFLELVQLFVELSNYHRHKCLKRKSKVNESQIIIVKPTKDTTVSNNKFTVVKEESD